MRTGGAAAAPPAIGRWVREEGTVRRVAVVIVALAVILAAGRLPGVGARQGTGEEANHPLVGSGEVTVSFDGEGPIEVTNLSTFTDEGAVLAANGGQLPTIPGVQGTGLLLTEGHGAWQATGERTADGTFVFFTLDQTGGISSTNTVRMSVEVDASGESYGGVFTLDAVSPAGNSMGSDRGTLRATRIGVEAPALPPATPAASPVATPVATPVA